MRPLTLHIEGFGVFREPVDISFEDVEYFALVGPTGAGKSTVIDAICFALYGSVPRYGDERLVSRAVSVGRQEAKVSLTFAVGDARYQATRVVRVREGSATTAEAVLEELVDEEDAPTHLIASKAREMRPAVEQLLGLPFAHFIKSVVLPQGEFAKFLHDEPAKRQDLLSRLLDLDVYELIGQRARQAASESQAEIKLGTQQLDELAFATEEARGAAARRREDLLALYAEINAAAPEDDALGTAIASAQEDARRAATRAEQLASVQIPGEVEVLNTALDDARRVLAVQSQALDDAQRLRTEADQRSSALPDPVPLRQARDAYDAIEELRPHAEHVAADLAAAVERLESADASADTSAAEVTAAQEALAATSVAHAAHALAVNLVAGEPCPVCAQVVTAPAKPSKPAALSTREKALKSAETAAKRARDAATKARAAHSQLASDAQQLAGRLDADRAALEANPDIDMITAQLAEIDAATKAAIDGRTNEEAARAAVKQAEGAARGVEARVSDARRTLQSRREEFLREGLDPPDPDDDLAAAWTGFAAWAAQAEASQRAVVISARTAADEARGRQETLRAALAERASNLDVAAAGDLGALRDSVVEAGTNAKHALERIEESIERATKLRERVDAARSEYDVADMLATHMRADRFERWVLVEAIELLVDAASQTLAALSAGHYSLRYSDEEFVVVDHRNADAERSVRTLSGGETFQASLALALALSDQLTTLSAGSRAKLEAIFLDEGFGTLDADTLDTVAATIETLGSTGRMVGVVTHVPALAERVPVRFRVTRTELSASVTREDA